MASKCFSILAHIITYIDIHCTNKKYLENTTYGVTFSLNKNVNLMENEKSIFLANVKLCSKITVLIMLRSLSLYIR